jgi:hypothetical protein
VRDRWLDGYPDRETACRVAWGWNVEAARAGERVRYAVSARMVTVQDAPVGVKEEAR